MGEVMDYSLTAGRVTVSSYDGGSVSSEGLDMSTCWYSEVGVHSCGSFSGE